MLQCSWIRLWDDLIFILWLVNLSFFLNEKQDYSRHTDVNLKVYVRFESFCMFLYMFKQCPEKFGFLFLRIDELL